MRGASRQKLTSWIAILAILLNTLAPAATHALAARDAPWLETCRDARTAVERGQPGIPGAAHGVSFEHCPYCAPHGASYGAPPVATPLVPADVAPPGRLVAHSAPWFAALVSFGPRPRAPPLT